MIFYVEAKPAMEMPEVFRGYQFTGPLRPGKVSPFRSIKPGMDVPDYAVNGNRCFHHVLNDCFRN